MHSTGSTSMKIVNEDRLIEIRSGLAREGVTLVQCHGGFDIVHPGHIRHLQFAAKQGDRLVVSITADEHVNKGPNRPMFSHELRAENLAALEFVDWGFIHHEPTATGLLDRLKPDIYIKGAEYASKNDLRFEHERAIVEGYNGRVVFSGGDVVFSSSSIVETIREASRQDADLDGFALLASSTDLSTHAIDRIMKRASGKRVVVVGETIVDTYVHCHWPEVAQEHPMLSLRPVSQSQFDGGGAIIALHLAALGARPVLCTPISRGDEGEALVDRMRSAGVEVIAIEVDGEMPEKKRYLVEREKVMKLDCTREIRLSDDQRRLVVESLEAIDGIDAMILADFGLGFFDHGLASLLTDALRDRVGLIAGDVSGVRSDLLSMRLADVLFPCEGELRRAMHDYDSSVEQVIERVLAKTNAQSIVVTRSGMGLTFATRGDEPISFPALSTDPIDVLGCGDALLAGMCISLLGDGDFIQASYIGSIAAALAGGTVGNVAVGTMDILTRGQTMAAQLVHDRASEKSSENGSKLVPMSAEDPRI